LKVRLALPDDAETRRVLLRQLAISIVWDDDKDAAVWSPLGDFFGYVGGASPFQTLPVGLLEDGTFCAYWGCAGRFFRAFHARPLNEGIETRL
jgi:hypothetical protein